MPMAFSVVLACTPSGCIARANGALPFDSHVDRQWFRRLTTRTQDPHKENVVIMGSKTWATLTRALPHRQNVILSKRLQCGFENACIDGGMLEGVIARARRREAEQVFVIGGAVVYAQAWITHGLRYVYVTEVDAPSEPGDVCVEKVWLDSTRFTKLHEWGDPPCRFAIYGANARKEVARSACGSGCYLGEHGYLQLVSDVIDRGVWTDDRTGVGTWSMFGACLRFDLSGQRWPLLTTKRVAWKTVTRELLWFIAGCTDAGVLAAQGVHIWNANGSREALDGAGLGHHRVGDLGPVYGFQWRHAGARYRTADDDYTGQGVDQLKDIIETLRDPARRTSRRLVMSAWNVSDLPEMALPPCHVLSQFYCRGNELRVAVYQRSADLGLGLPFNIASYALLAHLVARACGLVAVELIMHVGDAHVYANHEGPLLQQRTRDTGPTPFVTFAPDAPEDVFAIQLDHVQVTDYAPQPPIAMCMAV